MKTQIHSKKFDKIIPQIVPIIEELKNIIGKTQFRYLVVYIIGLILLENRQTMRNISLWLKLCYHDSLSRLLMNMELPLKVMSKIFISFIELNRQCRGYVIIDDVVISKRFSRVIECVGYAWCSKEGRRINGIHIVVLFWSDGHWRIPVGFRLWRQKYKTRNYYTKLELALKLIIDSADFCRSCEYLAFDSWYCSKKFLRLMKNFGITCVSSLGHNRNIIFNGQKVKLSDLDSLNGIVTLPKLGEVYIYRTTIGRRIHYLICTDTKIASKELRRRYKTRWAIEEFFRFTEQRLGLCSCQCRKNKAVVNHITIVFITYFALELLSKEFYTEPYSMKRMLQDEFYENTEGFAELKQRRNILKLVA